MANTYHKIFMHTVFAVKYRRSVIDNKWKNELCSVIGNLLLEQKCKPLNINGACDHIHCLFRMNPDVKISDIMKSVKAKSSKWINENRLTQTRFQWQVGYGCFSCSKSAVNTIYRYIANQEEHHKKASFRDEYKRLLQKQGIVFDEKYIFKELG